MDGHGMVYVLGPLEREEGTNYFYIHKLQIQVLNPVFILVQTELPLSRNQNQKKITIQRYLGFCWLTLDAWRLTRTRIAASTFAENKVSIAVQAILQCCAIVRG